MDRYTRRQKLKAAGYKLLEYQKSGPYRMDGNKIGFYSMRSLKECCHALEMARDKFRESGVKNPWDHNGWFCDDYQDEVCFPLICKIGKLWFSGYAFTESDCVTLDAMPDPDRISAILNADSMAEDCAEDQKEYNEQWQKGRDIESRIEESTESRKNAYSSARGWLRSMRNSTLSETLCFKIRNEIEAEWTKARELTRSILADLEELKQYPQ